MKNYLSASEGFTMGKIGIFFGTDTGTTRLIAKKIYKLFGDNASKPLNVNRISVDDLLAYDSLILGTPSYGEGQLPGIETGVKDGSWAEFVPELSELDMTGKTVALYGLGNQEKYPERFADSLYKLYQIFIGCGATIIGDWPVDEYNFEKSKSIVDDRFVGLIIDNNSQGLLTEDRLKNWVYKIRPELLENVKNWI